MRLIVEAIYVRHANGTSPQFLPPVATLLWCAECLASIAVGVNQGSWA